MKKSFLILTLILFSYYGCIDKKKTIGEFKKSQSENTTNKTEIVSINYDNPIQINSSPSVIYPLLLSTNVSKYEYGSSSSGGSSTFWNFVFYNTATEEYHLLDDKNKMLIYSYNFASSSEEDYIQRNTSLHDNNLDTISLNKFIYYDVVVNDYNKDGILNSDDPTALFISDLNGKNFKQISPDTVQVDFWKTIQNSNKILMMVTGYNKKDKKFDSQGHTTPLVYDLNKNAPSKEVFVPPYESLLKENYSENWVKVEE